MKSSTPKKKQKKTKFDTGPRPEASSGVIAEYKKAVKKHAKRDFPQDAIEQLVHGPRRRIPFTGKTIAPSTIAASTTSTTCSAPPSMCKRWFSVTSATPAVPA